MAKIGDTVRFLNTTGGGRIVRIDGQVAYVDDDGFEVPVMLKECVVVSTAPASSIANAATQQPQPQKTTKPAPAPQPEETFVETAEGEKLNLEIVYLPNDIKRLSQTDYEAYIVNDSNYWVFVTYLTRGNEERGWTTRYAGLIDPGMQIFMCGVKATDLVNMDRVAVQYVAYKVGKEFDLKTVACVEHRLDTTKFFKLHCFQNNPYFDEPAITLPIVRNDLPARQMPQVDSRTLQEAMTQKAKADTHSAPLPRRQKSKHNDDILVIDLHISELIDNTAGLSNADMLNLQIDKFREVMDANLKNHGKKIVFIHGKGEGVLRQAILKELNYRYKGHDVQDASFREYGFGATQVKI